MLAQLKLWQTGLGKWFTERAHGKWARFWLFVLSFTESSVSILAPDLLLIAILLVDARRWLYYSLFTAFAGVLGGVFGYIIAALFYDTVGVEIISFYGLERELIIVREMFNESAFWTVFLAAFTPIPYKIFVLGAGFFKINFVVFLLASLLGRVLRYLLIGYAVHRYGEYALRIITRYFTILAVVAVVCIALYVMYSLL